MAETAGIQAAEQTKIEESVSAYLAQKKNWSRSDYRLESKGFTVDRRHVVIWAIYLDDEVNPIPGAGRSLALQVDRKDRQIIKELKFQ